MGTSEVALRLPSLAAMLAAVFFLYRAARELFDWELSTLAVLLFCAHPIIAFAAIDARPYAFASLTTTAAIYFLLRLRRDTSASILVAFGILCALIAWFQFLFAVIWPALAFIFIVQASDNRNRRIAIGERRSIGKQCAIVLASFAITFAPTLPAIREMFRRPSDHTFDQAPRLIDLAWTLAPGWFFPVACAVAFLALIIAGLKVNTSADTPDSRPPFEGWKFGLCLSIGLLPLLIQFEISRLTPLHIFVHRYRLVGIPGVVLAWASVLANLKPKVLRWVFCAALVGVVAAQTLTGTSHQHGYSWRDALAAANQSASVKRAPVLICSDLPESDHMPMPTGPPRDSILFAPLSYYQLSVPVVPIPRSLNQEAVKIGTAFLAGAGAHRRFLAMGYLQSYETLDWLVKQAAGSHEAKELGIFDGVKVIEFTPR